MFNKNVLSFLLIILNFSSFNTFTMQRQSTKGLNNEKLAGIEKLTGKLAGNEKLTGIVNKLKDAYSVSAMFEQNINEWKLSSIIDDNELFSIEEQDLSEKELSSIIENLRDSEIERIKDRLEADKYGYLNEEDLSSMIQDLKNLKTSKTKCLVKLINEKIEKFRKKKSETKNLMSLAKKAGKTFTIGSEALAKDEKKPQPKTTFSNLTTEEFNALGKLKP